MPIAKLLVQNRASIKVGVFYARAKKTHPYAHLPSRAICIFVMPTSKKLQRYRLYILKAPGFNHQLGWQDAGAKAKGVSRASNISAMADWNAIKERYRLN